MTEIQAQNPRGTLLVRDELSGLLAKWDRNNDERSYYMSGWNNCATYTHSTISRGNIEANSICISVIGTTQPDILRNYLIQAQQGRDDGLIQRFQLTVMPDIIKFVKEADFQYDENQLERVLNICRFIVEMNFCEYGAIVDAQKKSPFFRFRPDAQETFESWYLDLTTVKIPNETDDVMKEHLAKYPKLIAALSLIFHCINIADTNKSGPVSRAAVKLAIKWCRYLESHARRMYSLARPEVVIAENIIKIIEDKNLKPTFTQREIYKHHRKGLSKSDIDKGLLVLIKAGWVKEEVPVKKLGRPTQRYIVNPKAFY